jgi:hypothetical protein
MYISNFTQSTPRSDRDKKFYEKQDNQDMMKYYSHRKISTKRKEYPNGNVKVKLY